MAGGSEGKKKTMSDASPAPAPPPSWAVALDGGTTNTRARLVRGDRIVATARRAVGVRDAVLAPGRSPLAAAVRAALDEVCRAAGGVEPETIVAVGMLSAEVGLSAVPHVVAPAGLEELARGVAVRRLPEVAERPIAFVPGVRTAADPGRDGWAAADVMRGEECETLGAWTLLRRAVPPGSAAAEAPIVFLWPGSHTKLVAVAADGRIARSQTTLAGELTAALARHTLLAASLPDDLPDDPDAEALEAGARLVQRHGLGRAAFLVRIAALTRALEPDQRAAFWIGAVIADDVDHLARHPILAGPVPVWVGGRQPQRALYARRLGACHRGPVAMLDDDVVDRASALGALAIVRRHEVLRGSSTEPA
jgi:2-dehydro-3-deoxygalactonokinase